MEIGDKVDKRGLTGVVKAVMRKDGITNEVLVFWENRKIDWLPIPLPEGVRVCQQFTTTQPSTSH